MATPAQDEVTQILADLSGADQPAALAERRPSTSVKPIIVEPSSLLSVLSSDAFRGCF
ncbi:MAG: hypothetical protein ACE5I3_07255 [Phycisphaerae bacterium]